MFILQRKWPWWFWETQQFDVVIAYSYFESLLEIVEFIDYNKHGLMRSSTYTLWLPKPLKDAKVFTEFYHTPELTWKYPEEFV